MKEKEEVTRVDDRHASLEGRRRSTVRLYIVDFTLLTKTNSRFSRRTPL
jgi:hypothetical protein